MALFVVTVDAVDPGVLCKAGGHTFVFVHPALPPAERDDLFAELLGPDWRTLVESAHAYDWHRVEDDAQTG